MPNCVKAYDFRGCVPDELSDEVAYRIGRAFVRIRQPAEVVVRAWTARYWPQRWRATFSDGGAAVVDIGLCGTEEVYFQTAHRGVGGGIMAARQPQPAKVGDAAVVMRSCMTAT